MPNSQRSSRSSASLLEVRLPPSRALVVCLFGLHLAGALPALLLPLPLYAALVWLAAILVSLSWSLRREPVVAIRRLADGRWRLSLASGDSDAELTGWYAHPFLCVARFKADDRRWAVAVPYWQVSPEMHRRLRAALRASQPAQVSARFWDWR